MNKSKRVALALIVSVGLVGSSAVFAAGRLKPAGVAVAVARSGLTVTPDKAWNKGARPGRLSESWTLDGLSINELTFYGGIADNTTLFREVAGVAELVDALVLGTSIARCGGSSPFARTSSRPAARPSPAKRQRIFREGLILVMQIVETTNEGLKRAYTRDDPPPAISNRAIDGEVKKIAPQVRMPGFRPGKVPANLVKKMHGPMRSTRKRSTPRSAKRSTS
jgi:hypothetical protein